MAPGFRKALRYLRTGRKLSVSAQRGSVLVAVLVAMAALTILGTTLSTVAFNDQTQTLRQQKNNEAYYLARSGAEAVAKVLLDNQENVAGYVGRTAESELGSGSFKAMVMQEDNGDILVQSTGYSGSHSEKVTLVLVRDCSEMEGGSGFTPDFKFAVFSNNSISLSGGAKVFGNIGTNSIESGAVNISWGSSAQNIDIGLGGSPDRVVVTPAHSNEVHYLGIGSLEQECHYPMPNFPEFPNFHNYAVPGGNLSTGASPCRISEDGYYNIIDVYRPLVIDVGTGTRKIRVKEMQFHGWGFDDSTIVIEGTGTLELYIEERFYFTSSSSINYNGNSSQVRIYYKGDNDVEISGAAKAFCCFFSQSVQSSFYLKGSGGIKGVIFLNGPLAEISGGTSAIISVLYAPKTDVIVKGSGNLTGAVICNTYRAEGGGAHITYDSNVDEIWVGVPEFDFETEPGSGHVTSPVYRKSYWTK